MILITAIVIVIIKKELNLNPLIKGKTLRVKIRNSNYKVDFQKLRKKMKLLDFLIEVVVGECLQLKRPK